MKFKLVGFNANLPDNVDVVNAKIPQIKHLRSITFIGLREAKELIEGEVVDIATDPGIFITQARMAGFDIEVYTDVDTKMMKMILETMAMAMQSNADPQFILQLNNIFGAITPTDCPDYRADITSNLHKIAELALRDRRYYLVEIVSTALNAVKTAIED
jgi:hypothetical protein